LSAQMVLAFQTIVSREINPLEPAVLTIGSIHGGTVHNIIPEEVKMQLTLRSYDSTVREHIITSIRNKSKHLALQAGLPESKLPEITINEPRVPATINDKNFTSRLVTVMNNTLGIENVVDVPPSMIGEDFSRYALQSKRIPISMFWLGTVDPAMLKESKTTGKSLPTLHSSTFAPMVEPAVKTGVLAMTTAALNVLK